MSIKNKLDYIKETKKKIKEALINKGVTINPEDTFRSYAEKINEIKGGSNTSASLIRNNIVNDIVTCTDLTYMKFDFDDEPRTASNFSINVPSEGVLVVATMCRDDSTNINGEEWIELVRSNIMEPDNNAQRVIVWYRYVNEGSYDVSVSQNNSTKRLSTKVMFISNVNNLEVIENEVLSNVPIKSSQKTNKNRLYILTSIYATNSCKYQIKYNCTFERLLLTPRFLMGLNPIDELSPSFTFQPYYEGVSKYDENTINLISIDIW